MTSSNWRVKSKFDYYYEQVELGYFQEWEEERENYEDKETYEIAVSEFGLDDAIELIEFNRKNGRGFSMRNLMYCYENMDWRSNR